MYGSKLAPLRGVTVLATLVGAALVLPACHKKVKGTEASADVQKAAAGLIELSSVSCPPTIDKPLEPFTCAAVDKGGTAANLTVQYTVPKLTRLRWDPDTPYSHTGKLASELAPQMKTKHGKDFAVDCIPSSHFIKVGVKVMCTATATAGAERGNVAVTYKTVKDDTSTYDWTVTWVK